MSKETYSVTIFMESIIVQKNIDQIKIGNQFTYRKLTREESKEWWSVVGVEEYKNFITKMRKKVNKALNTKLGKVLWPHLK